MKKSSRTTEINALKGKLMTRGLSLEAWAKINGYNPVTVRAIVSRHWGRTNTTIQGLLTHEILTKLQKEISSEQVPAGNG